MTSDSGGSRSPRSATADQGSIAARALPHVEGLDSLRAIAVVGVLVYHHDPGRMPGGWLGVSVFFTLSGFLVANLLLAERERSGSIDLGRFWTRRIRRLLPASTVAIGMTFVVSWIHGGSGPSFADDVRAAVLNVANWRFITSGAGYADAGSDPSPVQHYWSLAIEEQFYLVLPLVVVLCLPRRWLLATVVTATVAASLALQLMLDGVDRIYFGTDARAAELAVGVGLAIAWPWMRDVVRESHWFADAVGFTALAATGVLFATVDLDTNVVGSGALLAVTVLWVGLIVGAIAGPRFGRLLSIPVLPGIGRISYGIYLYHWPVYLLLTPARTGLSGPGLFMVRVGVTLALAGLSAWAVELPIRRSEWRTRPALALAAGAVVIVVAVSVIVPPRNTQATTLAGATLVTAPEISTTLPPSTSAPTTATTTAPGPPVSNAVTPDGVGTNDSVDAPVASPTGRVPRLLVVGDSTVANLGSALQEYSAATGRAEVQLLWSPGCAVVPYEVAIIRPGFEFVSPCGHVLRSAADFATEDGIDAVVVMMGTLQLADAKYSDLVGVHTILDGALDSRYRTAMGHFLERLSDAQIPVLWADVPTPRWDVDEMGDVQGIPIDGAGEVTTNDPARARRLNALDAEILRTFPLAGRWSYTAILAGPDGVIDEGTRYDGVHITLALARELVEESVLDVLETTYRSLVAGMPLADRAGDVTTWDLS